MLCSRCKKNVAVVFITKIEGEKQVNEGLCLSCARELGIQPLDNILKSMNIDESQLEEINEGLSEMQTMMESGENPFAALGNLMSEEGPSEESAEEEQTGHEHVKTKVEEKRRKKKKALDTYGTNLTERAKMGEIDRVIGRDREIDRVMQILNRRTKNNPVLLGEPGVGKTAIAEGLALRIVEKKVPAKLLDYQVYLLDFTALVAGTQFRGQFEARLKAVIDEVKVAKNILLVIDELHNIMGAGDADGAMNAANILKPALAKGDIQVLGATTLSEYKKHIEKDSALERRFQPVKVGEPTVAETIEILNGICDYYEKYHKVKFPPETLRAAAEMSERYVTDRFLPDKAIDAMDEAGSRVNLDHQGLAQLEIYRQQLREIQQQKENAVSADSIDAYKAAADLKIKECRLLESIEQLERALEDVTVTPEDIARVIEDWTGIPVKRITDAEAKVLLELEDNLHQSIIGQHTAVETVSRAIRRSRADIGAKRKPVSLLFIGPTGVGKTELVKALSIHLFGTEEAIIRVDMSEYMEKHSVSKLIGAPPGYVGYDEAGQLTEKVRRRPYSIILLDEIEKAHGDVFNLLLQLLDDGRITDSQGRTVNFENTIIIMTSNAGSDRSSSGYGFGRSTGEKYRDKAESALREIFRPEFLNRIDEQVYFDSLSESELQQIADLLLRQLKEQLSGKGYQLSYDADVVAYVAKSGADPKFGARPLRRLIRREIEDRIAEEVLKGTVTAGNAVRLSSDGSEIFLTIAE